MNSIGFLITVVAGLFLLAPVFAIVAMVRSGNAKRRLEKMEMELTLLRHVPGSGGGSDNLSARVRVLEERLDNLRAILKAGAAPFKSEEPMPPAPAPVPEPIEEIKASSIPEELVDPWAGPPVKEYVEPAQFPPALPALLRKEEKEKAPGFTIDWEQFTGVKLFSWIGGFALFLGAVFFAKYSIEHGLISPLIRVIVGLIAGTAAVAASLQVQKRNYAVTAQTLAAAGCAMLYADVFAAHSLYGFLNAGMAFGMMALITCLAFLLAVRMDAQYVAILGLVGGFLIPPLLSTGVDRPFGLFAYATLLDLGLFMVAVRKRWMFLWTLAAAGTLILQIGWTGKFFHADKMFTSVVVYLWFAVLFALARWWAEETVPEDSHSLQMAGLMPLAATIFGFGALNNSTVAAHPMLPFSLLVLANGLLAGLALTRDKLRSYYLIAGAVVFLALLGWTERSLTPALLPHALAVYLLFGALNGAFGVALHRRSGTSGWVAVAQLYPVLLLLPLMMALVRQAASPAFLWPVVFILNGIAILGALATGFLWALLAALFFSLLAVGVWLPRLSSDGLVGLLVVIAGLAGLFFGVGLWILRKRRDAAVEEGEPSPAWTIPPALKEIIPALGSLLPFILLGQAAVHLRLSDPTPVFALGALLVAMLVGLATFRAGRAQVLVPVSLLAMMLLQLVWHGTMFNPQDPLLAAPWYIAVLGFFWALPFLSKKFGASFESWLASAAAGPAMFYLLHQVYAAFPGKGTIGLLPAFLGAVYLSSLVQLVRNGEGIPKKQTVLAMFGGVALFFVSLIFPLQFDREWITLGWALEGIALVWLYQRIPHPGLKAWGAALLGIAFLRLAVNPAVLEYHPRTGMPLANWYLYAYGLASLCFFGAAALWKPDAASRLPRALETRSPNIFRALGAILLFLLMNIQIADYFSTGATLTFNLRGSLAQDMTYTLAWGLFALSLLLVGLWKNARGAQRASFALLAVAIGKLFFHDVWRLNQLYRAAAFAGLAVVLILSSFLYQRFLRQSPEVKP